MAEHEPIIDVKARPGRVAELMAGFSLACLLTLVFIGPLNLPGRESLYLFSITLPIFSFIRFMTTESDYLSVKKLWALFFATFTTSVVAFTLLLYQVSVTASWCFTGALVLVVFFGIVVGKNRGEATE